MHSSRMRTARCNGRLSCHACPLPCVPPVMHATTHAPCHACPLPCMPRVMHPLPCISPCHTCPLACTHPCHTCPWLAHTPATHAPLPQCPLPCTPPPPCMPPPRTEFLTHACENITLPQLGNKGFIEEY